MKYPHEKLSQKVDIKVITIHRTMHNQGYNFTYPVLKF